MSRDDRASQRVFIIPRKNPAAPALTAAGGEDRDIPSTRGGSLSPAMPIRQLTVGLEEWLP
jgi:hypothetical protein